MRTGRMQTLALCGSIKLGSLKSVFLEIQADTAVRRKQKEDCKGQVSGCCLQGTHNVDTVRLTGRGATIHSAEFCTSGSRSYQKKKDFRSTVPAAPGVSESGFISGKL